VNSVPYSTKVTRDSKHDLVPVEIYSEKVSDEFKD